MSPRRLTRGDRIRRGLDSWFLTVAPWVGVAGMAASFILNRGEFAIPFGTLAGLPTIVAKQRERNGRRDDSA